MIFTREELNVIGEILDVDILSLGEDDNSFDRKDFYDIMPDTFPRYGDNNFPENHNFSIDELKYILHCIDFFRKKDPEMYNGDAFMTASLYEDLAMHFDSICEKIDKN